MAHKSADPADPVEVTIEAFGGSFPAFEVESRTPGIVYDVLIGAGGDLISFSVRRKGPDAPPLTGRIFREARVESVVMGIRRTMQDAKTPGPWGSALTGAIQMFDPQGTVDWANPRRPGRPSRTDIEVALIARRYVSAVTELGGNGATDHLADELGLSKSTVLGILNDARNRRGLLSRAPKGRPGGRLTPKATALLDDFDDYERKASDHGKH